MIDAPKGKHADAISKLRSQAKDQQLVDSVLTGLHAHEQSILERRLETLDGEDSVLENPAARRVSQDIRAALEGSPDYLGPTRILFDRIVDVTIRYAVNRIDVEPGFAKGRFRFLSKPDAVERDLQLDYWDYLTSTSIGGIVGIESPNVGGGRVDMRFSVGGTRIVAELKRDEDPIEYGRLDPYLNQTGLYQSANVALGLLMVLDLSPKPRGQVRSLGNSIWVAEKPALAKGDPRRSIVTVIIPGNRPSPSGVG